MMAGVATIIWILINCIIILPFTGLADGEQIKVNPKCKCSESGKCVTSASDLYCY